MCGSSQLYVVGSNWTNHPLSHPSSSSSLLLSIHPNCPLSTCFRLPLSLEGNQQTWRKRRRRDIASFPVSLSFHPLSFYIFLLVCLSTRLDSARAQFWKMQLSSHCCWLLARALYKGVLERNTERTNKTLTASFQDRSNQKRQCELFLFSVLSRACPSFLALSAEWRDIFIASRFNDLLLFLLPLKKKKKKKSVAPMLFWLAQFFCFYDHPKKSAVFFKFTPKKSICLESRRYRKLSAAFKETVCNIVCSKSAIKFR